jgi:hypothetical protein
VNERGNCKKLIVKTQLDFLDDSVSEAEIRLIKAYIDDFLVILLRQNSIEDLDS